MASEAPAALRSALEIALEKHELHEDLSAVMAELDEHIALLEECWASITPPERPERPSRRPARPLRIAA